MKTVIGLVLALALLACAAQASDVVILTTENFDDVIKNNAFVLVEFFVRHLFLYPIYHLVIPCELLRLADKAGNGLFRS